MYFPIKYASAIYENNKEIKEFEKITNDDFIYDFMFSKFFGASSYDSKNLGMYGMLNNAINRDDEIVGMPNSFIRKEMTREQRITEWREAISMIRVASKWCQNKIVYQIDPVFEKELIKTKTAEIPYSILEKLPFDCFYVEFGAGTLFYQYVGFFVNVYVLKNGNLCIAVNRITPEEVCYHNFLLAGDKVSGFGVKNTVKNDEKYFMFDSSDLYLEDVYEDVKPFNVNIEKENIFILQLILYLCSDKADVVLSEESRKIYRKPTEIKNKYSEVRKFEVGFKFGKAYKEFEEKEQKQYISNGNGTPKKPHIRRAHWSTYHVGKGRTESVLRWISQIMIHEELGE